MALSASGLKAKMKDTIHSGLRAEFGGDVGKGQNYTPIADAQWEKMAEAISGIAADIVMEIVSNGTVVPGQDVVVTTPQGPGTGNTVSPGKIL